MVVACLGGQDDQQAAEDIDKVQEEVYGVPDVVITAAVELLHNELRVKQHKPTEEQQTKVQLKLGGRGGECNRIKNFTMHMHMYRISPKRPSQEKQNGANFYFISPSSEELQAFEIHCCDDLYHVHTVEWEASIGSHNSPLEGAMKLKIAPFAPLLKLLPMESFLTEIKIFSFRPKTMNCTYTRSPWFDFWSPIFFPKQHVT